MYNFLKLLLKNIFPVRILFQFESMFRRVFHLFYSGHGKQCNICNGSFRKFILLKNTELLCPSCGSTGRNRRLWSLLYNDLKNDFRILDFSPSRCLYRKLKENNNIKYISSDFSGEFLADIRFDITKIDCPDNNFDTIICYHILEHIENDTKAMQELYRVLKVTGKCYIQTPFKEGAIYEDLSLTLPEEREKYFGQKDHVRIYSVNGLVERLKNAGFHTEIQNFTDESGNIYGFRENETVVIASKRIVL
jgi:SAM-dependent methyltransferase